MVASLGSKSSPIYLQQIILICSIKAQNLISQRRITIEELKWHQQSLAVFNDNQAYKGSPLKNDISKALVQYSKDVNELNVLFKTLEKTKHFGLSITSNPPFLLLKNGAYHISPDAYYLGIIKSEQIAQQQINEALLGTQEPANANHPQSSDIALSKHATDPLSKKNATDDDWQIVSKEGATKNPLKANSSSTSCNIS